MIVQFTMKNVLSFKERTTLDLTAVVAYKEHEENLIDIGYNSKEKLIRVASVYGANASGKSNLYIGLNFFQRIIAESLNNVDEKGKTSISNFFNPFLFDDGEENSEYEISVVSDEYEYRYGFEHNAEVIVQEWCYRKSLRSNRTAVIFERSYDTLEAGPIVRKVCEPFIEQIPPETLALSYFNKLKLKTDIFKIIYSEIMATLVVSTDFWEDRDVLIEMLPNVIDKDKDNLLEFLSAIDTGIKDISYETVEERVDFITYHEGDNGKKYPLNMMLESEGTIKSIILFIYAQVAIWSGKSLFVDELNNKLHPLLLKFIVDLFYKENSKAQLMYTTHDTTLLDKKFFRRDQIWFVEKDGVGCSKLTALSDFRVRSDASFEKDYLAGVYGGIPFLGDFEMK